MTSESITLYIVAVRSYMVHSNQHKKKNSNHINRMCCQERTQLSELNFKVRKTTFRICITSAGYHIAKGSQTDRNKKNHKVK